MKSLLLAVILTFSITTTVPAQNNNKVKIEDLKLTPEQAKLLRELIQEYRQSQHIKRAELRENLLRVLTPGQRAQVRAWRQRPRR